VAFFPQNITTFVKFSPEKKALYISHWVVLVATVPKLAPKKFGYPLHQRKPIHTQVPFFTQKKQNLCEGHSRVHTNGENMWPP
jgi:hypothetical protein